MHVLFLILFLQMAEAATMNSNYFKGKGDLKIHYLEFNQLGDRGAIWIVPGKNEPSPKYKELVQNLQDLGFGPIFIHDHRGQGLSDRILKDQADHYRAHIDNWNYVVEDMQSFYDTKLKSIDKVYLIAHSMGGLYSSHFLARKEHKIQKAIFTSPLFGFAIPKYQTFLADLISWAACLWSCKAKMYGTDVFVPAVFDENPDTHSKKRFQAKEEIYNEIPSARYGGFSFSWWRQNRKAISKLKQVRVETPLLILQAGIDKRVLNNRHKLFCDRQANCRVHPIAGAYHAILNEEDEYRNQALTEIYTFFR